ncbi:orexin receptor type 2-like isoform X2 [Pomacea canaliculata]|uniref:orexin receptor type 2-like isoform X2 n=1 Tax=Pomacea canaliculata TaxID=400727 RepID=UPI000D725D77|nr:orexin receptor type 2-like isoform X2 [Pomacea canaliculata]
MPPNFAQTIWETWFLGRTLCKLVEYYQVVFIIVSILTLTAISVERWFAICRPLTFKQTRTRVMLCLVFIWIAAHVTAVPKMFIIDTVEDSLVPANLTILLTACAPGPGLQAMAMDYEIFLCVVFYAMPIVVMGYTYTAIAIKLWSSKAGILMESDSKAMMTQLKVRRRTAKMLIIVVIAFVILFLPVYIWNMIRLSAPETLSYMDDHIISGITLGALLLLVINSCINPIIYNFMSVKFRNEFRSVCHCWLKICAATDKGARSNNHEMEPMSVKRQREHFPSVLFSEEAE